MNWDFVITGLVIIGLILIIWARISKQTIKDVILDIKDLIFGGVEDVQEKTEEVIMYE